MWEECIKHIMECIEERDKDLPSFEKLHINEDDIDFILWSYYEFGEVPKTEYLKKRLEIDWKYAKIWTRKEC